MKKTNIDIVEGEIEKFKLEWIPGSASDFWCKKRLEKIIPEKAMLLVHSGNKYLYQLVIEKTEDEVVSVGICELEPSQLYRQLYKIYKTGRISTFTMLGEEGLCLVDKNSEEHKKYYEILRREHGC